MVRESEGLGLFPDRSFRKKKSRTHLDSAMQLFHQSKFSRNRTDKAMGLNSSIVFRLDKTVLFTILMQTKNMTDVLALGLTCRTFYSRLSSCFPTALDRSLPEASRSRLCIERILSVIVGCAYLQNLEGITQKLLPDEFFSVKYCELLDETRLTHLIRNYYHFISPSVGLHPEAVVAQLVKAQPLLLDQLFTLPPPVIRSLLQFPSIDELDLRLALARNVSLLIAYATAADPNLLLIRQRRHAADHVMAEQKELRRLERTLDHMDISFTTGNSNKRLPICSPRKLDIVNNRFIRMSLAVPGQKTPNSVMFEFEPQQNHWKSTHVITRRLNSFLPEVNLSASFLSVSS